MVVIHPHQQMGDAHEFFMAAFLLGEAEMWVVGPLETHYSHGNLDLTLPSPGGLPAKMMSLGVHLHT